jgi:hypothetical protein
MKAIQHAIGEAKLAYEFRAGSYTMSALNAVLSVEAIYLLERERTITGGAEQPKLGRRQVEAKAEGEPMRLRGRPRKYAEAPWKLAGISRATWYRRRETGETETAETKPSETVNCVSPSAAAEVPQGPHQERQPIGQPPVEARPDPAEVGSKQRRGS